MKTIVLALFLVACVSSVAIAADKTDGKSGSFAVEKVICSKAYVPATGNQSPDYKAGVDMNGDAVASADLNSAPMNSAPDYIEVPMTIDLAKRMNLPQVGAEAEMPVANLKIFKSGKVEYNGQDISSNAGSMCGNVADQKSELKSNIMRIEPAAGQDPMITAPSVTTNPKEPRYRPDKLAPQNIGPQAGSVAASTTSSPPVMASGGSKGTVNRAQANMDTNIAPDPQAME